MAAPSRPGRGSARLRPLWGLLSVIALWWIASLVMPDRLFPDPWTTTRRAGELLFNGLATHLAASMLRLLAAVSVAVAIGVPLGMIMGMNRRADGILGPIAYVLYPIPKIALLPVLMVILGLGNAAKITLVVLVVVFQLLLAARDGVRDIPREHFLAAGSLNMGRAALYRHVVIPATLPRVFTALRLSVGISFSVIFFAESFATRFGIGYFIVDAWARVVYLDMFAGILSLSLLGYLVFRAIDLLQNRACPWMREHGTP